MNELQRVTEDPRIIRVVNRVTIVMNRGRLDGINLGDRFLVYGLDDEPLTDPITGEDLGPLEIVKGVGVAFHVQDRVTTLRGVAPTASRINFSITTMTPPLEQPPVPFEYASVGDHVRPI